MRKRSKYRPKRNLLNPVGFVLESLTPVRTQNSFMLDLKLKNHGAMAMLMQGKATRHDIDTLISMVNIVEALRAVGRRGADTGKFIMNASEIRALNDVMELHDAQMDVIVLKDMERAIELVNKEYQLRRMTPIVENT